MSSEDRDGFRIRPGRGNDLEAVRAIYNRHIEEGVATFDLEPKSRADREAWFAKFGDEGPYRIFVAQDPGGAVVGFSCSGPFKDKAAYASSVEVSVYLAGGFRRRGLGGRLYAALLGALASAGVHRAYGGITRPNPASVALHEAFGFRRAGSFREVGFKFGAYHDVDWYELELDRPGQAPAADSRKEPS